MRVVRGDPRFGALKALGFRTPAELWGLEGGLPLAPATVTADLAGVPRAVANAIRRAAMCEVTGYAFQVGADFTNVGPDRDPHILPPQVSNDIAQIPLSRAVAANHVGRRFRLAASNRGPPGEGGPGALVGLLVYSGSIEGEEGPVPPRLFNPSFPLAYLRPGFELEVPEIRLVAGRGNGVFDSLVGGAIRPLDLPRFPDEEVRRRGGAAADLSGYRGASCEVAPRLYRLTGVVPATGLHAGAEARGLFSEACIEVARRVQALERALRGGAPAEVGADVAYSEVELDGGLREGRLSAADETVTLGELLVDALCATANVAYAGYDIVAHDSSRLKLTVRHACAPEGDKSVAQVIARALVHILRTFAALQRGFMEAPEALPPGYPHPLEPTPGGSEL